MSEWVTPEIRKRHLEAIGKHKELLFDSEIRKWSEKKGSKDSSSTLENLTVISEANLIENIYAEEIAFAEENKDKQASYNFEYFVRDVVDRIKISEEKMKKKQQKKKKKVQNHEIETQIHWLDYIELHP